MKKCEYIYADGFRFESGTLVVDIPNAVGAMQRLAVLRDGGGASRLDRFVDEPREDGATGEITLKDLTALMHGETNIEAHIATATGRVTVSLDPAKAMGRQGCEVPVEYMRGVLSAMPEKERIALAETQIYTMPYGTENGDGARERLQLALEVLPDGALGTAIALKSTNFLKHYNWKMATNLRRTRPIDYATINMHWLMAASVLDGSDTIIRNAHLGAQILGDSGNPGTELAAKFDMVKECNDQDLLKEIVYGSKNELLRKTALHRIADQTVLNDIALHNTDDELREIATTKLVGQATLHKIALSDTADEVRLTAARRIADKNMLKQIACRREDPGTSMVALGLLTDKTMIQEVSEHSDTNPIVRAQAETMLGNMMGKSQRGADGATISDQRTLYQIAINGASPKIRADAAKLITDQSLLQSIVCSKSDADLVALGRITDTTILEEISHQPYLSPLLRMEAKTMRNASRERTQNEVRQGIRIATEHHAVFVQATGIDSWKDQNAGHKQNVPPPTDQSMLVEIALRSANAATRKAAVMLISDQKMLARIVQNDKDYAVQRAAMHNITDTTILAEIALNPQTSIGNRLDAM